MKKYLKKVKQMSFLMAIVMLLTSVTPNIYGATTTKDSLGSYDTNDDGTNVGVDFTQGFETQYSDSVENESSQDTKVYVSQASTFSVTIPKTIILSGVDKNATYVVGVKGNISATDKIYVKPEESFLMKQLGKDDITALVTQDKEEFTYSDGVRENVTISSNGTIVANDMTAGSWNGSFVFNISLNEEPEIIVVANDQNGVDLNAKATYILGNDKDTLVNELVSSGLITNENEVSKLINVTTDTFENEATATIYVSKFANVGDKIAIYHYDESTSTWEYIDTCVVDENYQISANFTSFSPIALVNQTQENSDEPTQLVAGLYDENDVLLCSWQDSGIDVEIDYTEDNYNTSPTSPTYVLTNLYPNTKKIIMPNTINYLGDYNFYCCFNLQNITLSSNLLTIGDYCICSCPNIQNIIIPNNVITIGNYSFYSLMNIETIIIGTGVQTIGNNSFCDMMFNLTDIKIPNNVITIGEYSFSRLYNICNIEIENGLQTIGDYAFTGLASWDNENRKNLVLEIPDSVITIGNGAFSSQSNIDTIKLGKNVKTIGNYAFQGVDYSLINVEYFAKSYTTQSSILSAFSNKNIEYGNSIFESAFVNDK